MREPFGIRSSSLYSRFELAAHDVEECRVNAQARRGLQQDAGSGFGLALS